MPFALPSLLVYALLASDPAASPAPAPNASASAAIAASLAAPAPPAAAPATDAPPTLMLEQPAISAEHVAFIYAEDLWVADRDGGNARRLTTHPGRELRPRFSPDGTTIAFTGEYDGNLDVYLVEVGGGQPRRLTWHPGSDLVQGVTPDGAQVLFTSQRDSFTRRFSQLFRVDVAGGFPVSYELPSCAKAELSPDGKHLAYLPQREVFAQWKNYRGGTASRIWVMDLADRSVSQVPQPAGRCNDTDPMWVDGKLYFRSDREGEFNLFSWDPASARRGSRGPGTGDSRIATGGAVTQHTFHPDYHVADAATGGGRIVYEQAGRLHVFEPRDNKSAPLAISVAADLLETRPRFVHGESYVRSASISPSGARVAFGFRGEIVTVPAEKGDPRHLTSTPGANERYPAWSPDGRTIAWFSDESGENRLVLASQDGKGERRDLPLQGAGFYEGLRWSPDGKHLSFVDNARALWRLQVESGASTKVAQEPIYGVFPTLTHHWSPDSRWIAYTLAGPTGFSRVEIHDVQTGASHALTDGLSDASEPVFDAGGKYLWLAASTDAGPFLTWFSQASADIERTNALYLVTLAKDTPSPFAKESDEEKVKDDKKDDEGESDGEGDDKAAKDGDAAAGDAAKSGDGANGDAGDSAKSGDAAAGDADGAKTDGAKDDAKPDAKDAPAPVKIDFEGLAQRIVAVPLGAGWYSDLAPGAEGQLLYLKAERQAFAGDGGPPSGALTRFDLKERKETQLLAGVTGFELSAKGEKALIATPGGWWVRPVAGPIDTSAGKLALDAIEVKIDPRVEWRQIYDEVWRINRDCFYDPGMHGADWPAMRSKYERFLPHLTTRRDLSRVIRWLCSELAVGHSYNGGGDSLSSPERIPGGLLGADFEIADGRYRFAKVYGGLNWTPELRAPLTEPGVAVRAGEYLLAVQGRELRADENVFARFEKTAGKLVELTVGPNADGSESRTVSVVPIEDEAALRNRDWVEGNIAKVTAATNGRVAYVHVPDTADLGFTYFKRYFFPQSDREAIIVDERFNGGGSVADYYIDILRRPYIASWATRYGKSFTTPQAAIFGPKVMLIDENAGSGGDLLPWMWRKFELGKLIGRPTWGGLVGILGFPELMDGGMVTAPNLGFWTEEEGFGVENVGVPPDIEVEQLPALCVGGRDPQLERAIAEVMAELQANPPRQPVQPPFPVRVRR